MPNFKIEIQMMSGEWKEAGRWFVWYDNARGWVDCGSSYPAVTIKKPEA